MIDVIDDRSWHTIKLFAHYFLGIFFAVMVVAFILRFWEISDYSNRTEVKDWLMRYVADGWWRRGGVGVAASVSLGLLSLLLLMLVMNMISTQVALHTIPEKRIVGAMVAIGASVVAVIWALGFMCIKFSEASFVRYELLHYRLSLSVFIVISMWPFSSVAVGCVRYVSQNVSYTSTIILKRVVKAKLDIGILLMCCIYMPLVYFLVQSVTCESQCIFSTSLLFTSL